MGHTPDSIRQALQHRAADARTVVAQADAVDLVEGLYADNTRLDDGLRRLQRELDALKED